MSDEMAGRSALENQTFYERLSVPKDAPIEIIRKAYRKRALAVHPDRNNNPSAQRDFQLLSAAMETLADPERRRRYDAGSTDDDGPTETTTEAARNLYRRFTEADIIAYQENYVGSAEEKSDVKAAMRRFADDMQSVIDSVPFARLADADRFRRLFTEADDDDDDQKQSQVIPISTSTAVGPAGLSMRERERRRHTAMIESMTERFDDGSKIEEPPEDEFLAIQKRLDENKANRRRNRDAVGPVDRSGRRRRTISASDPPAKKRSKA